MSLISFDVTHHQKHSYQKSLIQLLSTIVLHTYTGTALPSRTHDINSSEKQTDIDRHIITVGDLQRQTDRKTAADTHRITDTDRQTHKCDM